MQAWVTAFDVYKTHSNIELLEGLIGPQTKTSIDQGLSEFVLESQVSDENAI